jgi:hypothetical protein
MSVVSGHVDRSDPLSIFCTVTIGMPYKLRKSRKQNLYWVVGPGGTHKSKAPIPYDRAEAQMRLLRAIEHGFRKTRRASKDRRK